MTFPDASKTSPADRNREKGGRPNRLIHEKSPYLLQHAHNPVDWYPWCPEALNRAVQEDRPILLSIGYSTCHWCHVMERESFRDPETARLMNAHFICIKVDREERPDLDQIYITAVSAMRGSAGWPLNVFLTPTLKPFYGGTYFPPKGGPGLPSWPDILRFLGKAWQDPHQRETLLKSADEVHRLIKRHLEGEGGPPAPMAPRRRVEQAYRSFETHYDPAWGGFSPAPKFPSPSVQAFLFFCHAVSRLNGKDFPEKMGQKALDMALHTLKSMAEGGIYDHVGGGFHRYATDSRWRIPHFEKMLYDNAQLVCNHLTAFQITKDPFFKTIATETLAWVAREMTHPQGGFFSAQDADSPVPGKAASDSSEKKEGAFYVWTLPEIVAALGEEEAMLFAAHYGILPAGNVLEDPHGEFFGKNILYQAETLQETARHIQCPVESVQRRLAASRKRLLGIRDRRPKPHLDDKIITAWNGLMISALAKAAQVLQSRDHLFRAVKGAEFLWRHLYDEPQKRLYRIWRDGQRRIPAVAEDYAAFLQGLLDLYETDFDMKWLKRAETLGRTLIDTFFDPKTGSLFMNPVSLKEAHRVRIRETHDGVLPSAASMATLGLFRMYGLTGQNRFRQTAESMLHSFAGALEKNPAGAPFMLTAARYLEGKTLQVVLAGPLKDPTMQKMVEVAHAAFHPARILILLDSPARPQQGPKWLPSIGAMDLANGKPRVYLCENRTCTRPVCHPETLKAFFESPKGISNAALFENGA